MVSCIYIKYRRDFCLNFTKCCSVVMNACVYTNVACAVPTLLITLPSSLTVCHDSLFHLQPNPAFTPSTLTDQQGSPYDTAAAGLAGSVAYHPYGTPLGPYPYSDAAYRKNATRDATATLKAWLNEHRKNPYPTKGEKIMLAIITKMTLTQVSTWFANARRRLKKENKVTWAPRAKSEDEEEEETAIDLEKTDEEGEGTDKALDVTGTDCEGKRTVYTNTITLHKRT